MELGYDDRSSKSYIIDNQQPKGNHTTIFLGSTTNHNGVLRIANNCVGKGSVYCAFLHDR